MSIDETTIDETLQTLLEEVTEVQQDIDTTNAHSSETTAHVESRVTIALDEVQSLFSELDEAEKDADESLDELILTEIAEIEDEEI